jgi:FAD/FMN-containing dehydrogenase
MAIADNTHSTLSTRLAEVVGPQGIITSAADLAPYLADWRGIYVGNATAVVRPANRDELVRVVALCAAAGITMVPQGGNTGMCGAATPAAGSDGIVICLSRMNRIIEVDALNNTMTVEAGCILANIQQAAAEVGRLFPLSLGAEGSCLIGGNLSTNAGGVNVLRYGNTRDLVLGLEVVLPDGRVWNGLRALRKDNTGYDLKQLFIGAEGTLGIISAAVLKLFPRPRSQVVAFTAVTDPDAAVALLAILRARCGDSVTAFELISRACLDLVFTHIPGSRDPLPAPHQWYVLTELGDAGDDASLQGRVETALADAAEQGLVHDAAIAASQAQAAAFWKLRESIPDAARAARLVYRHDISVAVSKIPAFIRTAGAALEAAFPGTRTICFGHLGDGNLHYNAFVPGRDRADAAAREATDVNRVVHDVVNSMDGSISAEHGIGVSKRAELARCKDPIELDLMRTLKHALDPRGLMNPGKIF